MAMVNGCRESEKVPFPVGDAMPCAGHKKNGSESIGAALYVIKLFFLFKNVGFGLVEAIIVIRPHTYCGTGCK